MISEIPKTVRHAARSIPRPFGRGGRMQFDFDGRTQISSPDNNSSLQKSISPDGYVTSAQIIKADKLWEKGINGQGTTVEDSYKPH